MQVSEPQVGDLTILLLIIIYKIESVLTFICIDQVLLKMMH